jgi:peptide/nickel transport system substrate-binding protein
VRKHLVSAAMLAALVGVAAACGSSSSSSSSSGSSSAGASTAASTAATTSGGGGHPGGTLHLVWQAAGGTLDPQVNYTLQYWQMYQATYDGLLAFKKVNGQDSFSVTPDLAEAMPTVTNGGKTLTFKLRSGIKFSNGQPVTTNDVVASFQRIFKVLSPTASSFYNIIVGGDKCLKTPATCTLAGGVIGDPTTNTITINLTSPNAEFYDRLAIPHASILPAATPPTDQGPKPIPTTGPYYFASYNPNTALKLVRNPYFKEWSHDAQPAGYPDEIDQTFGLNAEAEVTAIENGQADWMGDPPPSDRLAEMGSKYANQVHVNTLTAIWYAPMNTNIPPFNNLQARQAVNFAIDRGALVQLYGGPKLAVPSCQVLPPGFPGHQDYCPYTVNPGTTWSAPDLAKAKSLVAASGTAGQNVAVVVQEDPVNKAVGEALQSTLNQLGYHATLKPLSSNIQFTYIQNTKNKVQISVTQWYQDYPAASDFLHVLFGCDSFHPGSDSSINIAGFCNQPINNQMKQALALGVTNPTAANTLWAQIDKQVTDQSPAAVMFNPKLIDFLSARVKNYEFSKQFYFLVDQAQVQ